MNKPESARSKRNSSSPGFAGRQRPAGSLHTDEEERRVRYLQRLVDLTLATIAQTRVSYSEAQRMVQGVRKQAYRLFPDKKDTFELIYTPRFRRLIAEKYGLQ